MAELENLVAFGLADLLLSISILAMLVCARSLTISSLQPLNPFYAYLSAFRLYNCVLKSALSTQ